MNAKTPAELQLEFLKKLKEQQKAAPAKPRPQARPGAEAAPSETRAMELGASKRRAKKNSRRGIPVSENGWRLLREASIAGRKFKLNQALGDWAVELLLGLPFEIQSLSDEAKRELFEKIKSWSGSRGVE